LECEKYGNTANNCNHRRLQEKVPSITDNEGPEEDCNYSTTLSLTSTLDGDAWSAPCRDHFTPGKET
jgi:hypothetical protein